MKKSLEITNKIKYEKLIKFIKNELKLKIDFPENYNYTVWKANLTNGSLYLYLGETTKNLYFLNYGILISSSVVKQVLNKLMDFDNTYLPSKILCVVPKNKLEKTKNIIKSENVKIKFLDNSQLNKFKLNFPLKIYYKHKLKLIEQEQILKNFNK